MASDTTPDPLDYKGRVCRECHHFAMHPDLGGGDCRESPPIVTPPVNDERAVFHLRYPSHVPGTPACSRFSLPAQWRDWQRAFWAFVRRDLAEHEPEPPQDPPA